MLGHRKPRCVVAYSSQMFAKTTPKASSSFSNVKKRTSATRYAVNKILDWQVKWSQMEKEHLGLIHVSL